MTTNNTPRAQAILIAAHAAGMTDQELITRLQEFIDQDFDVIGNDVNKTIRANFSSDDDYDELIHEIDHALNVCNDDDPECMWNDDEDDDDL